MPDSHRLVPTTSPKTIRSALITGGAGFIGSHLADYLVGGSWNVVAFDNLAVGKPANIEHLRSNARFTFIQGEVCDKPTLTTVVSEFGIDTVFHLAAVHYIPACEADPYEAVRINVLGTQAVVDAAISGGVRKFVFTSTSDVYAVRDEPHTESDHIDPYTVYGTSKLAAERLLSVTAVPRGLSVSVARLFNVYGPRETNPHVLPEVIEQLRSGQPVLRLGSLWPRRDFVYVEDVARALARMTGDSTPLSIFNIGSGTSYSIEEAVGMLVGAVGGAVVVEEDPQRVRAVERGSLATRIDHARDELGWEPAWMLEAGLRRWIELEYP